MEVVETPQELKKGEGLYEIRYMADRYYLDVFDLMKKIEKDWLPNMSEQLIDRLHNFRVIYLNLHTKEVTSK